MPKLKNIKHTIRKLWLGKKENITVQMNVSNSISRILVNMPHSQNLNSFFQVAGREC